MKMQAIKLKGRLFALTVIQVLTADILEISAHLQFLLKTAPRLLERAPVVLDCAKVGGLNLDLAAVCQQVQANNMIVVAISGADAMLLNTAKQLGLALLNASKASTAIQAPDHEPTPTTIVTTQVRSGQQVVAKNGDLIIVAAVSYGAELLAHGNIHVYGPLRGRALAGIAGDKSARIFCLSMDAELLSIAGCYLTS